MLLKGLAGSVVAVRKNETNSLSNVFVYFWHLEHLGLGLILVYVVFFICNNQFPLNILQKMQVFITQEKECGSVPL